MSHLRAYEERGAKRPSALVTLKIESKDGKELDPEKAWDELKQLLAASKKYEIKQALFEPNKESMILSNEK